ncbi:MAG: hypothetical protein IIY12_00425 [Clostridia bacterium]|nr:hypothetical protein [Clostridia bacterium]
MDRILSEIIPYLPSSAATELFHISETEQINLREIRIKEDCPLLLVGAFGRKILSKTLHIKSDIETSFRKICASSAYSHRNEIRAGYVTIPGGHRVGIMGTAVLGEQGTVEGIRDIYGLSFRIAREFDTESEELLNRIYQDRRVRNFMIVGPPCSGKTTVLRSLIRKLSQHVQVSVVDEREELFPATRPIPVGCDVLRCYPKAIGILQCLRTLSPRVVACDEIGTMEEVSAMMDGLRSGVSLLVSAHAYSSEELFYRPPVRELILGGGIDLVAFLDPHRAGRIIQYTEREDLLVQMDSVVSGVSSVRGSRGDLCSATVCPPPTDRTNLAADSLSSP